MPVFVSHSEAVHVETREPITPERARRAVRARARRRRRRTTPATHAYPLATEAAGRDEIFVGRVRAGPVDRRTAAASRFWVVSDNLRKGAATNAVEIAEVLVERGWVRARSRRAAVEAPA